MDREEKAKEVVQQMEPEERVNQLEKSTEQTQAENEFLRASIDNLKLRMKKADIVETYNKWQSEQEE